MPGPRRSDAVLQTDSHAGSREEQQVPGPCRKNSRRGTDMELRVVGVVGAGVMGIGLGQNLSQTGHEVVLLDVSDSQLNRAKDEIRKNLRFFNMYQKGAQKVNADEILGRIKFTKSYDDFSGTDFVIENAIEKWDIKKTIY